MSKTSLLTSTALAGILVVPSAFAADVPPRLTVPAVDQTVASWAGPYVGFNVGVVWSQSPSVGCTFTAPSPCADTSFPAPRTTGLSGGLLTGINWQVGSWVLGFEGDINALGVQDSAQFPGIDPSKGADRLSSQYDWLGTARARAGFATGNALFYGTGGLAFGSARHSYDYALGNTLEGQNLSVRQTRVGWTVGGGMEYALSSNVSMKAEYLYVHLDRSDLDISSIWDQGPSVLHYKNDLSMVRLGLNYRF
jgi:outer membrane immunogenic protein